MNRTLPLILCLVTLAACGRAVPEDQAAKDARAVAMVERAQHVLPPVQPVTPETVNFADLGHRDVAVKLPRDAAIPKPGEGCRFHPLPEGPSLFVATPAFGLARFEGRLEIFAADSGSPVLSTGLHRDYSSGTHTIRLVEPAPGAGSVLTIRDTFDRAVFSAPGAWECGAAPA